MKQTQKRLVEKHQYLGTLLEKGGLYWFAAVFGCGGMMCLLIATVLFLTSLVPGLPGNEPSLTARILALGTAGFFGGMCVGAFWFARSLVKEANTMELVAPMTRHNVESLPDAEMLVRGSDRPEDDLPAELLRAVHQGPETPSEQLLRATQKSRLDV